MQRGTWLVAVVLAGALEIACAKSRPHPDPAVELEERWGIRLQGLRRSAAGYMLDFRFEVLDSEKAKPLLDRGIHPGLVDPRTGQRFLVPAPPKIGALRTTTPAPQRGRTYFILFANPGKRLQAGAKVTVEIGDLRIQGVEVL